MIQFIVVLRALACLLITNSHMEKVYPIKAFANGGLLGDVIFFAISGYLLYSTKKTAFGAWYIKRLRRVYLSTWLTVGAFAIVGFYGHLSGKSLFHTFIWPTDYHFVSSILVLYVVYYVINRIVNSGACERSRNYRIAYIVLVLIIVYSFAFAFLFDHSYYHIDNVYSPMIWPLYLFAMIIGMCFRIHSSSLLGKKKGFYWAVLLMSCGVYGLTKIGCVRGQIPPAFQWVNQLVLLITLFFVFRCFIGLENDIRNWKPTVSRVVHFVADISFEIYLVQIVLIPRFNIGKALFPLNFLLLVVMIVVCAFVIHTAVNRIVKFMDKYLLNRKQKQ